LRFQLPEAAVRELRLAIEALEGTAPQGAEKELAEMRQRLGVGEGIAARPFCLDRAGQRAPYGQSTSQPVNIPGLPGRIYGGNGRTRMATSATRIESQTAMALGAGGSTSPERIRETKHPLALAQNREDAAVVVGTERYRRLVNALALYRDIRRGLAMSRRTESYLTKKPRHFLKKRYAQ
jgi:PHD/YefM family antitoxin component YafN of YafNO toxin-antitoxin module